MGYRTEFNWVLKLSSEQGFPERVDAGATYCFEKADRRVYPVGMPVFLCDSEWNVCAWVKIKYFSVKDDSTSGIFEVMRVFPTEEKEVITRVVREMYNNGV